MEEQRMPSEALAELRQYDQGAHDVVMQAIRQLEEEKQELQRLLTAEQTATAGLQTQLNNQQQQLQTLQAQVAAQQAQAQPQGQQPQQQQHQQHAVQLPTTVKVEKPQLFKGQVDANAVETFLYQCELYFDLVAITDDNQRARIAVMFLSGDAATWFRSLKVPLANVTWPGLTSAIRKQFKPIDHERRARDVLASIYQKGSVQEYINTFRKALVDVQTVSKEEALDRFIRGLKGYVKKDVLVAAPQDWETAALAAERVASAGFHKHQYGNSNAQHTKRDSTVPMELGAMQSESKSGESSSTTQKCYLCHKIGHFKKDCPLKGQNKSRKNGQQGQ